MINFIIMILTPIFAAISNPSIYHYEDSHLEDEVSYTNLIGELTANFNQEVQGKYGLSCIGFGGMMMDDIKKIEIVYTVHHDLTIEEARALIINVSQQYLEVVNSNEMVRSYLHTYPITSEHLNISVSTRPQPSNDPSKPVDLAFLQNDTITYCDLADPNGGFQNLHVEGYEQALRQVK